MFEKSPPQDIGKFRDDLQKESSRQRIVSHLKHISAMFAAVAREPTSAFAGMINPARGVLVLGKAPAPKDGMDKVFTPLQLRTILETAERVKFGEKRHVEILWILKLMIYTGARPNELFQLQGGDVLEEDGVKFLRIQNTDAVTGKRHPHKSVKTGVGRVVPLHPKIIGFFDYARKFGKSDFIFGTFKWNNDNGRAAWLFSHFPEFLRNDCGIIEPTKRLVLYSCRHSAISAMRVARIPEDIQKVLVGHGKSVHQKYGGHELGLLAEYMATIQPCG